MHFTGLSRCRSKSNMEWWCAVGSTTEIIVFLEGSLHTVSWWLTLDLRSPKTGRWLWQPLWAKVQSPTNYKPICLLSSNQLSNFSSIKSNQQTPSHKAPWPNINYNIDTNQISSIPKTTGYAMKIYTFLHKGNYRNWKEKWILMNI